MDTHEKNQESQGLLFDTEPGVDMDTIQLSEARPWARTQILLSILLSFSAALNTALLFSRSLPSTDSSLSHFAGLERNMDEPYVQITPFSSDNETVSDQLWKDINIDHGVVALSDSWAAEHGLRTAQRFPWDQTKGIYILHGFHNLHCLKIIHMSLSEYRQESTQSRSWHHISHCMDALRRQILCDADDTPRATERRREVVSGLHQHRKCRSWEALEDFAKSHTACYKRPDSPVENESSKLERFKHCPAGSGYTISDTYTPVDAFLEGLPEESQDNDSSRS